MKLRQISLAVASLWLNGGALASEALPGPSQASGQGEPNAIPVAQTAGSTPAEPPSDSPRSRLMEEIVVTAQKREENLQDVPISVNAFSADLLDAKGILDPKDLPMATPGLTLGSTAGFTVAFLRGVGSDAFLMADPSVALYIDGIYFPFAHGLAQNFGAVERVEVLKGPQGTLFGRNAVGGAINVISQAPNFTEAGGSMQTAYGSFNELQTKAHVNVPLTDNLAISASLQYSGADNYRDGEAAGKPLPQEVTRGARVKLRWDPVESVDFTLAGFHLLQSGVATMFATNSEPSLIASAAGIRPYTGNGGAVDAPVYFHLDNTVVYGQGVWNSSWFDLKVLGSKQSVITRSLYDFDGSTVPLVFFEAKKQFADVKSAEVQLVSNADSWGADWLKWIAGGYFFSSRQGFDPNRLGVAGIDLSGGRVLGIEIPTALYDNLSRLLSALPITPSGPPTGDISVYGVIDTKSQAGFAQGTITFTDWLSLTLGGRYQVEDREIVKSQSFVENTGVALNLSSAGESSTTSSFKPKVSLELRPASGTLTYLSFQQAIKSATYNVINIYDKADYVKPEEMNAYEVGVKTSLFDSAVTLNAAAFQYDINNLQVQFISLLQGGAVTFENAGGARIRGADFDITALLFPDLIDNFVLTAGGAYLDAIYTDYKNASGFGETTGILTTNNDFTGNRIVRTPKVSGTVGLSKTFQLPGGPLEIGSDVYHNSGYYYLAQNGKFREKAYTLVGARVSYFYEPWRLRITAFGKNITDVQYNYSRFSNDFGQLNAVAPPATYGLRLNWDF